jgi:hypothetical protein
MTIFGITVKKWHGTPSNILVLAQYGEAYWVATEHEAAILQREIKEDSDVESYVVKVNYVVEAIAISA